MVDVVGYTTYGMAIHTSPIGSSIKAMWMSFVGVD